MSGVTLVPGHRCHHMADGKQVPCPPMCPHQSWPTSMFRRTIGGGWKLRRRHRSV